VLNNLRTQGNGRTQPRKSFNHDFVFFKGPHQYAAAMTIGEYNSKTISSGFQNHGAKLDLKRVRPRPQRHSMAYSRTIPFRADLVLLIIKNYPQGRA
jgi:hypothetical protein